MPPHGDLAPDLATREAPVPLAEAPAILPPHSSCGGGHLEHSPDLAGDEHPGDGARRCSGCCGTCSGNL